MPEATPWPKESITRECQAAVSILIRWGNRVTIRLISIITINPWTIIMMSNQLISKNHYHKNPHILIHIKTISYTQNLFNTYPNPNPNLRVLNNNAKHLQNLSNANYTNWLNTKISCNHKKLPLWERKLFYKEGQMRKGPNT